MKTSVAILAFAMFAVTAGPGAAQEMVQIDGRVRVVATGVQRLES